MSDPTLLPDDVPHLVHGLLSIGDAIGVAKSHGYLTGDVETKIVEAGNLEIEGGS